MSIARSTRNTICGMLLATVCGGAALTLHADTEWMILPKGSTSGFMTMHVSRDKTRNNKVAPQLIYDTKKQYGGKYKFLRITNNGYCIAGLNEKGLGVIFTTGDPTSDPNPKKSPANFNAHNATVILLRTYPDALQAVNRLRAEFRKKQIVGSMIMLIADPFRAFVVECSPRHFASWELPHAFCTYTHCWKLPGMDDGSIGSADRAQLNYQREWIARDFLRQAMEKNHGMIPLTSSLAVSRIGAAQSGKKTIQRGVANKDTMAAFTMELDPEFPDYLSTVYVAFGSPRHTVYMPLPFITLDKLPKNLLNQAMIEHAIKRQANDDLSAPVDEKLLEFEANILRDYTKARERARRMLREDRNQEAAKLLHETVDKQAEEIVGFLKK